MNDIYVNHAATDLRCPECKSRLLMRIHLVNGSHCIELWCTGEKNANCIYNPIFGPDWDQIIKEYGYGEEANDGD